ncbi:Uncharacterised protein [uncultured archaeon]|nr:Uncharacterised protein [uncultured archaeon]
MTSTSASPSFSVMAIMPPFLGLLKSASEVRFTVPFLVVMNRNSLSLNSGTLIQDVTFSSLRSSRFTMERPTA